MRLQATDEVKVKEFITTLLTDIVWRNDMVRDNQEPLIFVDDLEDAYAVVKNMDGTGSQDIFLSEITDVDNARIINVMNKNNITVTAQGMAELSTVPSENMMAIVKELKAEGMKVTIQDIRSIYHTTPQQ